MMRRLFLIMAVALGLGLAGGGAVAQSSAAKAVVDAAKAQGAVGEKSDGFLGLVTGSATPATQAAMAEINAGRAQAYRDIAARTGVSAAAAGEATAQQLFARLPPGAWYRAADGSWTHK